MIVDSALAQNVVEYAIAKIAAAEKEIIRRFGVSVRILNVIDDGYRV